MYWLTFIIPYSARNVFFSLFCHATPWWMIHKITIQHRIILFLFHAESLSNGLGITRAQLAAPWVCGACFRLCFWGIFSPDLFVHGGTHTLENAHTHTHAHKLENENTLTLKKRTRTHAQKRAHVHARKRTHTHTLGNAQTHENTQALSYVPMNVCVCSQCVFLLRLVPHAIRPLFPSVALEPWIIVFFSFFYKTSSVFTLFTLRPFCVSCFYSPYRDLTCSSYFYPSSCFRASSYACSVL